MANVGASSCSIIQRAIVVQLGSRAGPGLGSVERGNGSASIGVELKV